jgi:hypothetical protein
MLDSQMLSAIAAVASAIATIFAAYAAFRVPKSAAEFAEQLRRESEKGQERQRQKFIIFATLMQERSAIYTEDGVRSLNLIDVVFHDSRAVREAWAELYLALNTPGTNFDDKLRGLLATMANDIGLGDRLGTTDLSRVYTPNALAQERFIKDLERRQALARLENNQTPSANVAPDLRQLFPPKP